MAMSKDPVKRARQLANLEKGKFKKGQVANPLGAGAHKKSPLAEIGRASCRERV